MIGTRGPARTEDLEDRWLMNYAASVLDHNPVYLDNGCGRRISAHPAHLSHQEWRAITALHEVLEGLTPAERQRGVHSYSDTRLLRPLHAGDSISCVAHVQSIDQRQSGGRLTIRIDSSDSTGGSAATSLTSTVFRDVTVDGGQAGAFPQAPQADATWADEPSRVEPLSIDGLAPHIFSECARDYNPIHTDIACAQHRPARVDPEWHGDSRAGCQQPDQPRARRRSHPGTPVRWPTRGDAAVPVDCTAGGSPPHHQPLLAPI